MSAADKVRMMFRGVYSESSELSSGYLDEIEMAHTHEEPSGAIGNRFNDGLPSDESPDDELFSEESLADE
jgi:hypothetical protein